MSPEEPVLVGFPLRGEWAAANTPAFRVPSHGTDQLGQRYAYDFLRLGGARGKYYKGSPFQLWTVGVRATDYYGYGQPVIASFEGEVVEAFDGVKEKARHWPVGDILAVLRNSLAYGTRIDSLTHSELRSLVGNHVILKKDGLFAFYAHLAAGSVKVREGEMVREGEPLGAVGNTGNSTAPHLHFQLMDRIDILKAKGMPCAFKEYEEWTGERWKGVRDSMPGRMVRIRLGP